MQPPIWIDVFLIPVRDNRVAQVAVAAVLLLTLLDVLFGLLFVADIVDGTIVGGLDLGFNAPVLVVACAYLCIMEISSLLEQFVAIDPDLKDSAVFKLLESANTAHTDN